MDKVFDKLRRKEVPLTEEEKVRQWFIDVLLTASKVPQALMSSEVSFKYGEKQYRADILIWDRNAKPLAVVECKRPSVMLSSEVLDQAVRYNMALNLKWLILTNGTSTVVLKKENDKYVPTGTLPEYAKLLSE